MSLLRKFATAGAVVPWFAGCPIDHRTLSPPSSEFSDAGDAARNDDDDAGAGGQAGVESTNGSTQHGTGGTKSAEGGNDQGGSGAGGASAHAGNGGGLGGLGGLEANAGSGGLAELGGLGGLGGAALGGHAGLGGGGAAASGRAGTSGAGAAGSAGAGGVPSSICGDLDDDGKDDCGETLARNSRFDSNIANWQAEYQVASVWDARDAASKSTSGALAITFTSLATGNGISMAGATQCIPSASAGWYALGARAFIPSDQPSGTGASINVFLFDGPDCTGSLVSGQSLPFTVSPNAWQTLVGEIHVPPAVQSMAVRLVTIKRDSEAAATVLFDDVLVRAE